MDDIKPGIDRKTYRLREESLARKRNQDYHKQLYWNDITNYYKTWGVQATKYNVWASQPHSPHSAERQKEIEETNLGDRRAKLSKLLTSEQRQYEEELKEYKRIHKKETTPYDNLPKEELEKINLELKLKEEEARRYRAAVQKYHQYKNSHPILQDIEKKKKQESMKKCWIEQMKEKQQQDETEKKLMQKLEDEAVKQRMIEEEKEKEAAYRKQEETKKLKEFLLNQMEEMRIKDALSRELKQQEEREIKLKTELEKIAVHRNQMENQRRTKQLRSILKHQYQAQLKQRTREVQDELKEDKRLIDEITRCLEKEEMENNRMREETRKEIDRANTMLAQYAKLEKQREREMEFMFFEEARKMWQKQEANWNIEQEARDTLMRDVLVTLQKQVKEKLQQNTEQHKVLLKEKDELLHKIDDVNKQLKDSEQSATQKKKEYMADLQQQIREKELEKENSRLEEENEFREKQAKLKEEEEKILEELRKLSTTSRNPIARRSLNE